MRPSPEEVGGRTFTVADATRELVESGWILSCCSGVTGTGKYLSWWRDYATEDPALIIQKPGEPDDAFHLRAAQEARRLTHQPQTRRVLTRGCRDATLSPELSDAIRIVEEDFPLLSFSIIEIKRQGGGYYHVEVYEKLSPRMESDFPSFIVGHRLIFYPLDTLTETRMLSELRDCAETLMHYLKTSKQPRELRPKLPHGYYPKEVQEMRDQ